MDVDSNNHCPVSGSRMQAQAQLFSLTWSLYFHILILNNYWQGYWPIHCYLLMLFKLQIADNFDLSVFMTVVQVQTWTWNSYAVGWPVICMRPANFARGTFRLEKACLNDNTDWRRTSVFNGKVAQALDRKGHVSVSMSVRYVFHWYLTLYA